MNKIAAALLVTSVSTAGTVKTFAQEQGRVMLEEVVVTAQKRAESVQDVPIAISAFSGDFVQESDITDVGDLTYYAPGLNGDAYSNTESVFTIRGIGTAAFGITVDSSVGIFIDGIALGRPAIAGSSFFDVERVEVLNGPQGTLFGRNTSAGAISVITRKPDQDGNSLDVLVGTGDIGQKNVEAAGNWAATDRLAFRLAVRKEERDGSFKSEVTGRELNNVDDTNVRLGASFDWTDSLAMNVNVEKGESNGSYAVGYVTPEAVEAFDTFPLYSGKSASDYKGKNGYDYTRATMHFNWDINESLSLVSNTGYYDNDYNFGVDADAFNYPLVNLEEPQNMEQWSQEFRLNGSADKFDWFVGVSAFKEDMDAATRYIYEENLLIDLLVAPGLCADLAASGLECQTEALEDTFADTQNTSYAVYGDIAWNFSDNMTLTVGGRYSSDEKDFSYVSYVSDGVIPILLTCDPADTINCKNPVPDNFFKAGTTGKLKADDSWSSFDPRVVSDYRINDDVMVYASYASGFKSGGFNQGPDLLLGQLDLAAGDQQKVSSFDEETNDSFEAGMKGVFWDGRARLNVAAFYSEYSGLQIENTSNLVFAIENAADATSQGIELGGQILLTDNFELRGNYTYMDASFDSGMAAGEDISGNYLGRAPEHSGALSASYSIDLSNAGELSFRGDYAFVGEQYFDANNRFSQDSYGLFGARASWRSADQRWSVAVIGANLSNEEYTHNIVEVLDVLATPAIGRNYRVELSMSL
ncbi:TonB-dependent receptor [Luminiphilus sp.]|nr:TonB-dependent receptor [Luminiphilus sp.]